jgi:hypothetical protein
MGTDRLNFHFFAHSPTRSRDVSDGRTTSQHWGLREMSLLTGPPASTGGCQTCLLTGPPDSTGGCQSALVEKLGVSLRQYHHIMIHIANQLGMNSRPVEAAVLRHQSHPIIANLPVYQSRMHNKN